MDLYAGTNTARSHASTLTDYSTNPTSVSSPVHNTNQSSPGAHVTISTVNGNVTQITRRSIFGEAPIGEESSLQHETKPTRRASMYQKNINVAKPALAAILTGSSMDDDPILKSMMVSCGERSDADLIPIIEFIKGLRFFQIFTQYPETFKQVAQQLELQTFFKGGHVFFEGQPGNEFYIVLDGEISIVKKKRISAYSDFITENITLVKLSCGQTFGETALDSVDGLRTASAVATKRSSLLVLHRENYHKILFYFKSWLKQAVCNVLLSSTSIFHNLPIDTIHAMSARAVIRSFSINAEIVPEGGRVSSLMIVKSGIVRLVKSISKHQVDQSIHGALSKFDVGAKVTNALASPPSSPPRGEHTNTSSSSVNSLSWLASR
ncbi:cyclic nucleotide-binding domain-containing protein [archaeon]|nr:MAG: cyclic nucleotide-binding domain-containing protein [archaeon]